jgi:hypothetical protein
MQNSSPNGSRSAASLENMGDAREVLTNITTKASTRVRPMKHESSTSGPQKKSEAMQLKEARL